MACESSDIENIIAALKSAGVSPIGQTLQMCYDKGGNKYDVPVFILNDPLRFEISDNKLSQFENKEVKV